MSLFFGVWFIVGWLVVWVSIFLYSGIEWNKRGHDPKTGYDRVVSLIISGVMALAIALTFNAAYNLYKYLPNEENITAINGGQTKTIYSYEYNVLQTGTQNITPSILLDINKTEIKDVKNDSDKEGEEALKTNVYNNLTEGSKTFNEFASFFTSPIAIILGFLAILFIIKIETERLQNERRHNRKKAEENLVDTAYYGIELLKDFDRRHIDFFIRQRELKDNFGLVIDTSIIKKFPDLEQFVIETRDEKNDLIQTGLLTWPRKSKIQMQPKIYYSQELIKRLCFMKSRRRDILDNSEGWNESLKRIYYSSIASIFSEHVKRKTTDGYSDIGDDVNKIQSLLEDIFLKTDFNMNAPENKSIVEHFLQIEQGVRDFYDIQSGIFVRKIISSEKRNKENDDISDVLKILLKNYDKRNNNIVSSKDAIEKTRGVLANAKEHNKPNIVDIEKNLSELENKVKSEEDELLKAKTLVDDQKRIESFGESELSEVYSKKTASFLSIVKILFGYYEGINKYLIKSSILSKCEVDNMFDFYKALKQTHKEDEFEKLFTKMVADDKAVWRAEKFAEFKGFYEYIPSESRCEEMDSEEQAKRCIAILIRIWQECQAYYNYFDLFKNLHELKDTMDHRNRKSAPASRRHLTFLGKEKYKDKNIKDDEIFELKIEWFEDKSFCDYSELLEMYFKQHKSQSSDKIYKELFIEKDGICNNISRDNYTKFIDSLLGFIKSNYIEEKTFNAYASKLKDLCTEASHEEVFGKIKP